MTELKGSKTEQDLREAFAGESQANRRYLAFAAKAEQEGYAQEARLFRAAAESETVHAHNHLRILGQVGDTAANLKQAVEGESYEFLEMYPGMIKDAEAAGYGDAARSFRFANAVEQTHAALFQKLLERLGANTEEDYFVCRGCGHLAVGEAPETCPVCGAPRKMFKKVD